MNTQTRATQLISLEDKVAVVTGAASGIGRATAIRFAELAATVALLDVNVSSGEQVAKEIQDVGGRAHFFLCDVISKTDCEKVTDEILHRFNKIDILFNNAGVIRRNNVLELTEEEWDRVVDTDLKSIYLLSKQIIPHMIKNGGGSIINTGSGWSLKGGAKAAAYCAAKGGVLNLTRAMAIDHGKHQIRVNCVCPGDVETELLHNEARQLGIDQNEFLREAAKRPLNRVGQPEDVANAVLFFASKLSSWVTGAHLVVDGGGLA
ncbi:MAG: SDR family NAD(P)-dependent oxidoreductase [bacterium]